MDLSKVPARLSDELAIEWKDWILAQADCSGTTELSKELSQQLGGKPKAMSLRPPLTDFLNGYCREVDRWLNGEGTSNGEALCQLMGESVSAVRQRFQTLALPSRQDGLDAKALDHLPLVVALTNKRGFLRPLEDWLREQNHTDLLPEIPSDEKLGWNELKDFFTKLDDKLASLKHPPTVVLRAISASDSAFFRLERSVELAKLLGQSRLEALQLRSSFIASSMWDGKRPDSLVKIEIPFRAIGRDNLDDWLKILDDLRYLNHDAIRRAHRFFDAISLDNVNALSPAHLRYALDDAQQGIAEEGAAMFQRRRAEWLRRDLRKNSTPLVKQWLQDTREFFSGWIEKAGTLEGDVTARELDEILGSNQKNRKRVERASVEDELLRIVLATSNDEPGELRRSVLKLISDNLKTPLHESGLLETSVNEYHRLSPNLRSLGELELPLYLEPDQLAHVDVDASYGLVADAVRLADPGRLGDWCEAALGADEVDQPWAIFEVLRGLSQRVEPLEQLDRSLLQRLWASAVWADLYRLHWGIDDAPPGGFNRIL